MGIFTANTFILMWNPEISSFRQLDWTSLMSHLPFEKLNWSVWDHTRVDYYDKFYMVRVGKGNTGIVMKGFIESLPKRGEDWSGKGRIVYYCDLSITSMIDSEKQPIITTEQLQKAVPDFDWTGGHSGQMITKEQAKKLNQLWEKYEKENKTLFTEQKKQMSRGIDINAAARIKGFDLLRKHFETKFKEEYTKDPSIIYQQSYYGDKENLSFDFNYETSTFHLKYELYKAVLHLTCSKIISLKTNIDFGCTNDDWFRIYAQPLVGTYELYGSEEECRASALHLEANGIDIICEEISFDKITPKKQ